MNKSLNTLLTISVLINVLLIGVILGLGSNYFSSKPHHFYKHHKHHSHHKDFGLLSEEKKYLIEDIKKNREEVFKVLLAPQFDPNLYDQKVNNLRIAHSKLFNEMSESIKSKAQNSTQKEREELVQKLKSHHRRH